jgi:DNA repair exonuclease SbcCD ATPase subunit
MHFKSLRIEGALSHKDTTLELAPLTVFRGFNGSGKSTIVNCFNALVTGRTSFTNEKGQFLESLIRAGEDKCVITAEVGDAGETRILRTSITEKSGRTPTCKKADDAGYTGTDYLAMLAMKRDVLRVLIDGSWFFNPLRSEADQKELLASIILPATVEFDKWVWDAMTECGIGANIIRTQKPFELIQECYDAAFNERKAVNRYIKDWREPEKPANLAPNAPDDIRARLKDRQDKRTECAVRKQKLVGDWDKQKSAMEKSGQQVEALKKKLESERWKREDAAKGLLSAAALKEHKKIAGEADKARKIDADVIAVRAEIAAQRRTLTIFTDAAEAGNCPTCLRDLPEDAVLGISDPIAAKIQELTERERELLKQRQAIGDVDGAQKNLDAHATAEKQVTLIDEHIAEAEKDLAEAEKQASTEMPAQPDTTAIDAELADFDRRIEMGNAALQEAIRAESAVETHKKAMEAKATLDKKKEALEKLLDFFGPKGISAKLLDESVAPFEASMNKILAGWGFECRLSFSPFAFMVRNVGSEQFFPLKTMSESQQQMFRVSFQVALAKVTKFNFVVIDRADVFLDSNRAQLYKNLMAAELEQIIIFQSDDRREVPKAARSAFYMLSLDKSNDPPVTITERL